MAILFEFVPRILFFWPLFGYMMSLMFLKWIKYGANKEERKYYSPMYFYVVEIGVHRMFCRNAQIGLRPIDSNYIH